MSKGTCSTLLVAMRAGVTPVPIPNTTVKTCAADGTTLETVWESRWPPASLSALHTWWQQKLPGVSHAGPFMRTNAVRPNLEVRFGDVAQLGEHLPCKQGVESSSLFVSINRGL